MDEKQLTASYARRATEYIDFFGSIDAVHPDDLAMVGCWARGVAGPVLDAGCGPGQWTAYLNSCGVEVAGLDLVPEFVAHAQAAYPGIDFRVGSMASSGAPAASMAGILAWYSLIHLAPEELAAALAEFRRVLRPGGDLLIGFFDSDGVEPFEHKVATAYRWPLAVMAAQLVAAGFEEVLRSTRIGDGHRPHAAIIARVAPTPPP